MPGLEELTGLRIVASAEAIDAALWPAGSTPLRIAADEVFLLNGTSAIIGDHHAIIEPESTFQGRWLDRAVVEEWVAANADWLLPTGDGFWQGMVAALPVKVWASGTRALVIVPASFGAELEARL